MKKPSLCLIIAAAIMILSAVSACSSDQTISQINNPNPGSPAGYVKYETPLPPFKPISLVWFYHAPSSKVDPQILVDYFSFFVSSSDMTDGRDQLKSMGSTAPIFQYVVFNELVAPASCADQPYFSQVANKAGDYCAIDRLHPDWFLKDASGERMHNRPPYDNAWFMDPGNPGWREFWLERMRALANTGWDGVFLDNLEPGPRNDDQRWQNYPDVASIQQATREFLQLIYDEFHPKGVRLFANIINVGTKEDYEVYLPYLDGIMMEAFSVGWEEDYYDPEFWEIQMQTAVEAQSMGKELLLIAQGSAGDIERQKFALASYLLINNGKAYFRYTDGEYDELLMFPDYLDEPGAPLGDRYFENGQWVRKFENGEVAVDPVAHTSRIDFTP